MTAQALLDRILAHSHSKHPQYTKEQHMTYVMGFLASIVMEKNHMDNIVWAKIKYRLEQTS
jgi:hypothetical protein